LLSPNVYPFTSCPPFLPWCRPSLYTHFFAPSFDGFCFFAVPFPWVVSFGKPHFSPPLFPPTNPSCQTVTTVSIPHPPASTLVTPVVVSAILTSHASFPTVLFPPLTWSPSRPSLLASVAGPSCLPLIGSSLFFIFRYPIAAVDRLGKFRPVDVLLFPFPPQRSLVPYGPSSFRSLFPQTNSGKQNFLLLFAFFAIFQSLPLFFFSPVQLVWRSLVVGGQRTPRIGPSRFGLDIFAACGGSPSRLLPQGDLLD